MPDIKSVIKQMIEDGEPEDVIDAVVKRMKGSDPADIKSGLPDMSPPPPPKDEYRGPDTFWGGVRKSLTGDEFNETAKKSLKGFAKGTAAIPDTIADTLHGLAAGGQSLFEDPAAHFRAMPEAFREMGRGIRDVTKNAGADPEAFGHLSGQLFGQPAFTEGLIKAPAITKATTGAINRIPAVNKTFSSVGNALQGTRDPKILPQTSRGFVAGAARAVARPVGRALSRVGERGRLDAGTRPPSPKTNIKLKGETETPHSPDSDIFAGGGEGAVRPRPVRRSPTRVDQNSEFTRPILETPEELAARNRPSAFTGGQSRRNQSRPFEPRPVDTTPYPRPGEAPPRMPPEPPPIDPFAAPEGKIPLKGGRLKQNRRNQSPPYVPSVDPFAPPSSSTSIGVGEGGLSSRYRHRPYTPGEFAEAAEGARPKPKPSPPARPFEPAVDPAAAFSPEDLALMRAKGGGLKTALEKMASGETVDPTTGEIISPRRAKNWRQSEPDVDPNDFDIGPDEPGTEGFGPNDPSLANDAGRFADEVEATRYPGDEAYDLGEIGPGFRQTSNMPDWGPSPKPRTIQLEEWGDWGPDAPEIPTLVPDASGSHVAAPKVRPGVNPLRPEVPPGQVTNRSMFENSEMRGMENRIANQNTAGRRFAEEVSPAGAEFSEDMLLTPAEQMQPDIPPMRSPVENQYDPRISNMDQSLPNEGPAEFSGRRGAADTADDAGRTPELQAQIASEGIDAMGMDRLPDAYHYYAGRGRNPELAAYIFNERIAPILDRVPADQFPQLINHFERTGNPELADYIHQRAVRPPEPVAAPSGRDVRWDAETESLFDRNSRNWDDVTDATPEEIARAKGINKGTIEDPTGGKTNFSPLDLTERGKRGKGQDRLNSLFGEDTGQRLGSGESTFGPSEPTTALRQSGNKRLDKATHNRWSNWADEQLNGIPAEPGKAGLEVEAPTNIEGPGRRSTRMTYRDANGKAIGVLETDRTGSGVANFAVSSKLGLGRGKVAFKMLKEAIDRGITESSGQTSNMTKNLFERIRRLTDDAKANANDEGMFGNSEMELEINKILDNEAPEGFGQTQPTEEMGFAGRESDSGIANDSSKDPRWTDKYWKKHLDKAESNVWEGADRPTDSWGLNDIWTRNSDFPPMDPYPQVANRAFGFEGEGLPTWQDPGAYPVDMFDDWPGELADAQQFNIPIAGKYPDRGSLRRANYDAENALKDLPNTDSQFSSTANEEVRSFNVDDDFGIAHDEDIFRPSAGDKELSTGNKSRPGQGKFTSLSGELVDEGPGKLVKKGEKREKNFPSVIPDGFGKVGGRQVGPKGASYTIRDPNGKKLGDINVTPKDIAEMKASSEDYAHFDDGELAEMLYQERLGDMLGKYGYYPDEPKISIEPKTTRTKDMKVPERKPEAPAAEADPTSRADSGMYKVQTEEGVEFPNDTLAVRPPANAGPDLRRGGTPSEMIPEDLGESLDYSGTGREPRFSGDKPKGTNKSTAPKKDPINPDVDFGPGGDPRRIIGEFHKLSHDNAVDTRFRALLPKEMRGELGPGETYKGKMEILAREIMQELKQSPEEAANRLKEMDAERAEAQRRIDEPPLPDLTEENLFNESVIAALAARDKAAVAKASAGNSPLPKLSKIDKSQLKPGKLDAQSKPWFSPRVQQQFNASWRKRTGQPPKKPKK